MSLFTVIRATAAHYPDVIRRLQRSPGRNALALQDLMLWPERSTLWFCEPAQGETEISYLLRSGHPGTRGTSLVMEGDARHASALLEQLPEGTWTMRETPASFSDAIRKAAPDAKFWSEVRMETTADTFQARHTAGRTRRLTPDDAPALAALQGAPPAAAPGFVHWIRGATIIGLWDDAGLAAIASTFVTVPDVWYLVGITTRKDARGRGYGTEVTSALTARALEEAPVVSLTVLESNAPAIGLYEKLGYRRCEQRIWVDNGAGSSPEIS